MIKGVLIVNNHGKPRLIKLYDGFGGGEEQQQVLVREVFASVANRSDFACNFIEVNDERIGGAGTKIVYRHYATLYFILIVDSSESELGILDLIQVFVETLDKNFENVCELDLIFHHDRVNFILDEIIMGGMVLETNINEILNATEAMKEREGPQKVGLGSRISEAFSRNK
eukprot:TRINITY_DN2536_c0_g1_i14.p1 TRINITY_DN2536_c0_g1~~TRINITY_DN2536_c0_g1_i14.p1  ORF type:complete len:171 (-),score=37.51 TRINITY_DN2536_c0_g1_i14:416-928(-)